jgi:uncharacterized protein YigE (DUF2233 family)
MKRQQFIITSILFGVLMPLSFSFTNQQQEEKFISYTADLKKQDLKLYWKDDKKQLFKSIGSLKTWLESKNEKLVFAMNGGMYKTDNSPLGLFIQEYKTINRLNKANASGNFYLNPNGVFYITSSNEPTICTTQKFIDNGKIKYATQSGPMLVIDGKIHPGFKQGSTNVNIRNGVGILPGNKVIFAMSKGFINFYDFAEFFKKAGCINALYLDGAISQTYLPEKNWVQAGGNFGVIIGATAKKPGVKGEL